MIKMRTDSNDNAIQEQNRALGDLHQLHVDDIGAVGEEISRVEFKHDGLSVSKNFVFFSFFLYDQTNPRFQHYVNTTMPLPASCQEYLDNGPQQNGTFRIQPAKTVIAFDVECVFINDLGLVHFETPFN